MDHVTAEDVIRQTCEWATDLRVWAYIGEEEAQWVYFRRFPDTDDGRKALVADFRRYCIA